VDANCEATDSVQTAVYITGDMVGGRYQVTRANPLSAATMPAVGVVIAKSAPTVCRVHLQGLLQGIFTSLTPSAIYFVGTDGEIAKASDPTFPPPGGVSRFQQIGVALAVDWLMVIPLGVITGWIGTRYFQQVLIPTANPRIFLAPQQFKHGSVDTEVVYYNGQRLTEGSGNDYFATESGGAGTGYDSIVLTFDPAPNTNWYMDYMPNI
jgi:hypothetical protein